MLKRYILRLLAVLIVSKPLPDLESFKKQVRDWTIKRNAEHRKINWQFTTQDARIRLLNDYLIRLNTMAKDLNIQASTEQEHLSALDRFMKEKGYFYTLPYDIH